MQMRILSQELRTVGNFYIQSHVLIFCVLKFNQYIIIIISNVKEAALENANEDTVEALIDINEDVVQSETSYGRQLLHSKSCLDHLFSQIYFTSIFLFLILEVPLGNANEDAVQSKTSYGN